jgi:MgtC family
MLLTIAACLFTLVSAYGFGGPADPSRLAAQIITGIGFLGSGAIVRHGLTVRGLTTAASIWATASIGVAVGAGRYLLAAGVTLLVVGTLLGCGRFATCCSAGRCRASSLCCPHGPASTWSWSPNWPAGNAWGCAAGPPGHRRRHPGRAGRQAAARLPPPCG